uniref:Uncharacterized protein n=1 Tax=Strongyloides venezuelensis TaxID=75913 RepID=A0A0K0EVL5_STRVS
MREDVKDYGIKLDEGKELNNLQLILRIKLIFNRWSKTRYPYFFYCLPFLHNQPNNPCFFRPNSHSRLVVFLDCVLAFLSFLTVEIFSQISTLLLTF